MILVENYKVENDGIWISKEEIQSWKDHYENVSESCDKLSRRMYYKGKAVILIDLLKTIEQTEDKKLMTAEYFRGLINKGLAVDVTDISNPDKN